MIIFLLVLSTFSIIDNYRSFFCKWSMSVKTLLCISQIIEITCSIKL